jgi:galactokinase
MSDFQSLFGHATCVTAEAPGRVNLIGEHTDYNGGFVLPAPIPQRTRVQLAPRPGDRVRVLSTSTGSEPASYTLGTESPGQGWLDFVQGVTRLLRDRGHRLTGFDARIKSDVPLGSGLSSSAALTVSLLRALRAAFALELDDLHMALAAQEVENRFVGAQVGVMDPMACALGQDNAALFLDTRSLHYERVPLPPQADLIVINSGVAHQHAAGDYNSRRAECEQACKVLGVPQLRDLGPGDLARIATLNHPPPEPAPWAGRGAAVAARITRAYAERSGCRPTVLVPVAGG